MLTIIHGDDTAASRNFFLEIKKKTSSPVTFEADTITLTDLVQVLEGGGLFAEEKDIFIESLLTKKRKSAELTAILERLQKQQQANIYLWEGKEIDRRTLTTLKTATPRLFKLPQSLFEFLDSLEPENTQAVRLFHKTLETVEVEMLFFMLIRQFRLLLALSDQVADPIDEVKRMQPWQRTKLQQQSALFAKGELISHYRKLYEIDLAQKTGGLPSGLTSAIDIWLLEL